MEAVQWRATAGHWETVQTGRVAKHRHSVQGQRRGKRTVPEWRRTVGRCRDTWWRMLHTYRCTSADANAHTSHRWNTYRELLLHMTRVQPLSSCTVFKQIDRETKVQHWDRCVEPNCSQPAQSDGRFTRRKICYLELFSYFSTTLYFYCTFTINCHWMYDELQHASKRTNLTLRHLLKDVDYTDVCNFKKYIF